MQRLTWFAVLALVMLGVIGGRFFQLQVMEGEHWSRVVERAQLVNEPLPPLRGRILDRHGQPLADTRPLYHVGVVLGDLELGGRARRVPLLVLDRQRWLALGADLGARLSWSSSERPWHERLVDALLDEPFVCVRGARSATLGVGESAFIGGLVTVPRAAFARPAPSPNASTDKNVSADKSADPSADPSADSTVDSTVESNAAEPADHDLAVLATSDLLSDDPRVAIAKELSNLRRTTIVVYDDARFQAMCARLDQELNAEAGRCWEQLAPYTALIEFDIPVSDEAQTLPGQQPPIRPSPVHLRLRWASAVALRQGVDLLAAMVEEPDTEVVQQRWQRLHFTIPAAKAEDFSRELLYGCSTQADAIAPRLPDGFRLGDVPLPEAIDPERVLIIQGDPPDREGGLSLLCRRVGGRLGISPDLVQGLLTKHAEIITPNIAERRWGRRHVVLDPDAIERLSEHLSARLSGEGVATTANGIRADLAAARRTADRERSGQTRFDPILIRRDISATTARGLDGLWNDLPADLARDYEWPGPELPGVRMVPGIGRAWPRDDSAVHLLGMLSGDPDASWPGALKGVTGLEKVYDQHLRGVPGLRVRRREPEGLREIMAPLLPVHGQDLITEIDADVQQVAEDALTNRLDLAAQMGVLTDGMQRAAAVGKGRAGFVLMDINTGALLVLASNPRYHPEDLRLRWNELMRDPAGPLHDWSCEADQPPGSSFKILTMLGGLEQNVVSPGEIIHSKGYMMLMANGQKILRDHAAPGDYDLSQGIQKSSNVYSATIAERLHRKLGAGWLGQYAARFGLGRRPGLDIDQARAGILPTPSNLKRFRPDEKFWSLSDSWRMGIGQFCAASPLQVVTIAAAVANGGHIVQPYLVRPSGGPVVEDIGVRQAWIEDVRHGMELVTEPGGTARLLVLEGQSAGIKIAAKTGTAEWGSALSRQQGRTPDHGWMIGYAPADRPTVAFACFVHSGTYGGLVCTPIVKHVLEAYFARYGREGHLGNR